MGGVLREQDRFLPIANVARIMKKAIPSTVSFILGVEIQYVSRLNHRVKASFKTGVNSTKLFSLTLFSYS